MEVNYPQTILKKSYGSTAAEAYLSRLCDNTFLSLWSYPNVFRDQGRTNSKRTDAKGNGKELCDLLVVFENHVFIFSDKQCAFTNSRNIQVDWSRWYKKAVRNAANQIFGAERWIFEFPDTIYIDSNRTQPFPYLIPSKENAIVHRIIVAHGISEQCIKMLGGTGSLMLFPYIIGDMHIATNEHQCIPFAIGQISPDKGYIHVFDDTSLEIVLKTLDTISDFTRYITKKEELICSNKLVTASGEDDLLAHYLQNIDESGEHTFIPRDFESVGSFTITEGIWENFTKHPSRLAQIEANEISYSWDKLIEKFLFHITTGTSYLLSHPEIKSQEEIFRFLAKENRTRRRLLSSSLHDLIAKTPENYRTTRIMLPSKPGDPYYLFFLLPRLKNTTDEKYRDVRKNMLENYLKTVKLKFPAAVDIIGLATETGTSLDRSEDLMYLDGREWTDNEYKEAKEIERELTNEGLLAKRKMYRTSAKEYPDKVPPIIHVGMKGSEQNLPCPCGSGKKFKKCCGRE